MDTISEYGLTCTCANKAPRKRVNKAGAVGYGYQCLNCGRWDAKKRDFFGWSPPTEEYDESIYQKFSERRDAHFEQTRQERNRDWWNKYNDYLSSPQWQSRRDLALKRDRFLCQGCLVRKADQVHHLSYEHIGREPLFELVSLCSECHKALHPHMQENKDVRIDWNNFR